MDTLAFDFNVWNVPFFADSSLELNGMIVCSIRLQTKLKVCRRHHRLYFKLALLMCGGLVG